MDTKPKITVSSLDLSRLEKMIDNMKQDTAPGIDDLVDELARAEILAPEDMPSNIVTMNSTVRFKVASSNKEFSLTLVYPQDSDGQQGKISILAPVGSALLGLAEGDQIQWPKPGGGQLQVEIIEVLYQPERAGEMHL
ncbi:nucleoside diphosphate kinase regulator [Dasania sp. GY-MA-18]|uniref:Nucleoside diphosphate kinase regulator n=1 Tax=Dasania phycosphaerae TaxID=2950436 RepID=A0A9J6RMB5_9GAMM|nr:MULTISPECIES: nucleoside diphosphate kinase regulator [Dasania]MCR8923180.1 nucleoside diphosphate kinase regulator [Dasania sp. GY-MA-18]MCZ0865612.1 nucleoside diphosphate kinase regulator [Dasania phycosphaerae]MCZ0869337.1 nucleoside diphosphate kinase regulator [Dasania phycosphaerae]